MISFTIGATTTFPFILPINTTLLQDAIITFKQAGKILLEKKLNDSNVKTVNNSIIIKMTENESYLFSKDYNVFVQVKIKTGSTVMISNPVVFDVKDSYNKDVLSNALQHSELTDGTIPLIFN